MGIDRFVGIEGGSNQAYSRTSALIRVVVTTLRQKRLVTADRQKRSPWSVTYDCLEPSSSILILSLSLTRWNRRPNVVPDGEIVMH